MTIKAGLCRRLMALTVAGCRAFRPGLPSCVPRPTEGRIRVPRTDFVLKVGRARNEETQQWMRHRIEEGSAKSRRADMMRVWDRDFERSGGKFGSRSFDQRTCLRGSEQETHRLDIGMPDLAVTKPIPWSRRSAPAKPNGIQPVTRRSLRSTSFSACPSAGQSHVLGWLLPTSREFSDTMESAVQKAAGGLCFRATGGRLPRPDHSLARMREPGDGPCADQGDWAVRDPGNAAQQLNSAILALRPVAGRRAAYAPAAGGRSGPGRRST